ncbi:TIGR04283 family arsenosugar biosynthesis glycosyltransferase [Trichlorobacter ammonificans]|uniref:Glycosyl transferase family 2 n=1 Tax=Trichlorobacter ammonificans TaxID=2916410 RepID=A0ABN8HIT2_9BACT|nr:TIGR04283 family arsenosugar biosynthesis glycosyltransferase [Trichlorobacter ammonificans]CAH2031487.1 Glycosyl transferase family 2 [Trichlorobacter ammonificans]
MKVSVIIPVLFEAERINDAVEQVRRYADDTEIIVVDGDPAGSTLSATADTRIVHLIAPPGRGSQLAAGVRAAHGDLLLLLHADTLLPADAFASLRRAAAAGADWGSFRLGIDAIGAGWRLMERIIDLRCRLFSLPYGDQAIFLTRDAIERIGGIPEIPLMEDVALVRSLKCCRLRGILLPERVRTSPRRWQRDGIVRRSLKNWWLLLRYLAGTPPERLAREY